MGGDRFKHLFDESNAHINVFSWYRRGGSGRYREPVLHRRCIKAVDNCVGQTPLQQQSLFFVDYDEESVDNLMSPVFDAMSRKEHA